MRKHTYAQLRDQVLESLLFVEKFRKDEFSINEAIAAQTLSLTRRELKPAEDLAQAMAGGDL